MSERKDIRAKVATILSTPAIAGVAAVFKNKQTRISPPEMPAIIIYTKSESAEVSIAAPREYKRILKLAVDVACIDTSATLVDDFLDDTAAEIEQRLFRNETLDGLASDLFLSDTEIDFITDSENEIGLCRLTFDVIYYTKAPVEQLNLEPFERYNAEYKLPVSTPTTPQDIDETELPQ